MDNRRLFFFLLVLVEILGLVVDLEARGGGGCFLPDTRVLLENGCESAISSLKPGDRVRAFTMEGAKVGAEIERVFTLQAEEYFEVVTERGFLVRATAEHPFFVGDGVFRNVEALRPGDPIFTFREALVRDRVKTVRQIRSPVRIYNIQTDSPNTFVAAGIAVHNKGGGCFPAGTMIEVPGGLTRPVEGLAPGDKILSGDGNPTTVRLVAMTKDEVVEVETTGSKTRTTMEHPFLTVRRNYVEVGDFSRNSFLKKAGGAVERVLAVRPTGNRELVYEIEVDVPHSYVANGFIVHNKGGGGFRSSSRSSFRSHRSGSSHRSGPATWWETFLTFGVLGLVGLVFLKEKLSEFSFGGGGGSEELDVIIPASTVHSKASATEKMVERIGQNDAEFTVGSLKATAEKAFKTLQMCWEKRSYSAMAPLVCPTLQKTHEMQIRSMIQNHEINRIEKLKIEELWIVHVNYSRIPEKREFAVLIQASARDYYIDDRTNAFIRGSSSPERFQEFWVFRWKDGAYKLGEIEQTKDSDLLSTPNRMDEVRDADSPDVAYAPPVGRKVTQGLAQIQSGSTSWDQREMKETARAAVIAYYLARESNEVSPVAEFSTEALLNNLGAEINARVARAETLEYRNICVRKIDICMARPAREGRPDEFVARIGLHAQRIKTAAGAIVSQDMELAVFETMLRFERAGGEFKLAELLKTTDTLS